MLDVKIDKYSFIINGNRLFVKSAAVHYFRLPGFELWKDRLKKLKYAGYNVLDIYISWAYHCSEPMKYDFKGIKDIHRLIEIANECGFYIIARPGPYINAELSAGGLPGWLLKDKSIVLRNRQNNDFIYSKKYMDYVKDWYNEIIPRINSFPNTIAVQIENEYFTNEMEPEYIQELYDLTKNLGCKVPLMHNDMYSSGFYSEIIDLYAIDNYSVTYFDQPWQSFPEVFSLLDTLEENVRPYSEDSPLFIAELQAGWFDNWGNTGYKKIRKSLGVEHIDIVTKTAVSQGVTAFNHYMSCGGTNWNNLGSTEVYTSYDFASPIKEGGMPSETFAKVRNINSLLDSFDFSRSELAENQPEIKTVNPSASLMYCLRNNIKDDSKWLFIRNDSTGPVNAIVNAEYNIDLNAQEMMVLLSNLNLSNVFLEYTTLPIFCRIKDKHSQAILVQANHDGELLLNISDDTSVEVQKQSTELDVQLEKNQLKVNIRKITENSYLPTLSLKEDTFKTTFFFVPESMLDEIHRVNNSLIVIGPDFLTDENDTLLAASNVSKEIIKINANGQVKYQMTDSPLRIEKIRLHNWDSRNISDEIVNSKIDSSWKEVIEGLDADTNGIHEGFFWYKAPYKGSLNSITLEVRHCFAVYLNGKEIYSNDCFQSISGADNKIPLTISIPPELEKEVNNLTVLIQSMGHNKGFEDDAANPRGILSFIATPETQLKWYIKKAFSKEILNTQNLIKKPHPDKKEYLTCSFTSFNFDRPKNHQVPLGLLFDDVSFNKADIYLNGYLIGHFWKDKGPQKKFYLPESFYNLDGKENQIKLVIWSRSIDKQNYKNNIKHDNIYIEPYEVYRLSSI